MRQEIGCGGADKWTVVPGGAFPGYSWSHGSGNLFCDAGHYCPNTTTQVPTIALVTSHKNVSILNEHRQDNTSQHLRQLCGQGCDMLAPLCLHGKLHTTVNGLEALRRWVHVKELCMLSSSVCCRSDM